MAGRVERKACEWVMFGVGHARRFTQDSPILPDVWVRFADDLTAAQELLLTPFGETRAGDLRKEIAERLKREYDTDGWTGHELIYNQSTVLAKFTFRELVRVVLPITDWWANAVDEISLADLETNKADIAAALRDPEREASKIARIQVSPDLLWLIRTIGFLAVALDDGSTRTVKDVQEPKQPDQPSGPIVTKRDWLPEVEAVIRLIDGIKRPDPDGPRVWTVNLNRPATTTIYRSSVAVKADAARRLFEVSCKGLAWAIVDSGIDATHPAFRLRLDSGAPYANDFENVNGRWENRTRVVATYDFCVIRDLLNPSLLDPDKLPPRLQTVLAGPKKDELIGAVEQLKQRLISGNEIEWRLLEPLLEIPQDDRYEIPRNDHGTHCAGILAADWRTADPIKARPQTMMGICPDLRLYDLRVFDENGFGDEFSIIAALQYIRYKNAHQDYYVIHGANLSMSIKHDVMNFACGRTPVCDEAERLVGNGVVVVAAAGNEGYVKYETTEGMTTEGYRSISITDPGNADLVITVGATHRFKPHTYGVSYFSSRGPTGDGRIKPDIVAPGEKIESAIPNRNAARKDGTSMATPHVSGAAALLMARYEELIGKPGRIKQILMSTATDLGRERYFQGAGMVDVLRALQSV